MALRHNLSLHSYTDDSQLYLKCLPTASDMNNVALKIQDCLADIKSWMSRKFLKLNMNKTELKEICPFQHANYSAKFPTVTVDGISLSKQKSMQSVLVFIRPISLFPSLSKVLEKLIKTRFIKFFDKHEVFYDFIISNMG